MSKLGVDVYTSESIALKVFSQSVSGKLFNILAQKVVLFIYIHDNAQIIAQVNVLTQKESCCQYLSLFSDLDRIRIE